MEEKPIPAELISGGDIKNNPVQISGGKEIESTKVLVDSFNLFKDSFKPKADLIYYPCSGPDISITKSFPESKIIFLDQNDHIVDALREKGLEAIKESAETYDLKLKADIMLLYNPQIRPSEVMLENLSQKGYLLCNDYHSTASLINGRENFSLKAIIRSESGSLIFDTEDLQDYWKEVDSEEAFKNSLTTWGSVNYHTAKNIVEEVTGKSENILEEYKKIIIRAKESVKIKNEEFLAKNPSFARSIVLPDENSDTLMWVDDKGKQHFIITSLPRKKATVDSTFIFYKQPKN